MYNIYKKVNTYKNARNRLNTLGLGVCGTE